MAVEDGEVETTTTGEVEDVEMVAEEAVEETIEMEMVVVAGTATTTATHQDPMRSNSNMQETQVLFYPPTPHPLTPGQ
jgi:hypothetical protein